MLFLIDFRVASDLEEKTVLPFPPITNAKTTYSLCDILEVSHGRNVKLKKPNSKTVDIL